ncbi:MAG: hypothetical protein WAL41_29305, partial [Mycobacterium sp.]
ISVNVNTPGASTYGQSIIFTATVTSDTGAVKGRKTAKRPKDVNGQVVWSANTGCSTSPVSSNPPQTATCTTSILGGGTDTVTATYMANDSNHTTASGSVSQTVNAASCQIITCSGIPSSASYNSSFTASCMVGCSGLPVSYSSSGTCLNSGGTYTMTSGTGSCLVTASQAGNSNYNPAPPITDIVNATLASQRITCTTPAPATGIEGSSYMIACSSNSGLPVSYASTGPCTLTATNTGVTVMIASNAKVGSECAVVLVQAGNNDYSAAAPAIFDTTVVAAKTLNASLTSSATAAQYGTTFTATASSNETGVVSDAVITSKTPTICAVMGSTSSGAVVTATVQMLSGSGSCDLSASWAINTDYKAASKSLTVTAQKATPTVSFTGAPATATNGANFAVTAASSTTTATPTLTASGSCTVGSATNIGSGTYQATVTMTKATGTCTTKAAWAATTDYAAASTTQKITAE